jgi:hypothetical protein
MLCGVTQMLVIMFRAPKDGSINPSQKVVVYKYVHDLYFRTVQVVTFILFKSNSCTLFKHTFTFTFKTLSC